MISLIIRGLGQFCLSVLAAATIWIAVQGDGLVEPGRWVGSLAAALALAALAWPRAVLAGLKAGSVALVTATALVSIVDPLGGPPGASHVLASAASALLAVLWLGADRGAVRPVEVLSATSLHSVLGSALAAASGPSLLVAQPAYLAIVPAAWALVLMSRVARPDRRDEVMWWTALPPSCSWSTVERSKRPSQGRVEHVGHRDDRSGSGGS